MRHPFLLLILLACLFSCSHNTHTVPETFPFHLADGNSTQLKAAQRFGLERTLPDRSHVAGVAHRLVKIANCRYYRVDRLGHSVPYLTPKASDLLETIGREFQKALKKSKLGTYRIIVTSVLRTEEDVRKLMKKNGNAVKKSTHQYAATFDITYSRFDHVSGRTATQKQLKYLLGMVLNELRDKGRCYVMYEKKQPCFHITSRK